MINQAEKDLRDELEAYFPECFESVKYQSVRKVVAFEGVLDADIGGGHVLRIVSDGNNTPRYKFIVYKGSMVALEFERNDPRDFASKAKRAIELKVAELYELLRVIERGLSVEDRYAEEFLELWEREIGFGISVNLSQLFEILPNYPIFRDLEGSIDKIDAQIFIKRLCFNKAKTVEVCHSYRDLAVQGQPAGKVFKEEVYFLRRVEGGNQ